MTSFGLMNILTPDTDVTGAVDSSFGEFSGDARVSSYAEWIDEVTAFGPEFLVNQTVANNQSQSAVAMDSDGDFVITWTSYGQDGVGTGYGAGLTGVNGVFARRFSGSAAMGDEFQVNTYAEGDQEAPSVAIDADGDFVITWESHGQDGDGSGRVCPAVCSQRADQRNTAAGQPRAPGARQPWKPGHGAGRSNTRTGRSDRRRILRQRHHLRRSVGAGYRHGRHGQLRDRLER